MPDILTRNYSPFRKCGPHMRSFCCVLQLVIIAVTELPLWAGALARHCYLILTTTFYRRKWGSPLVRVEVELVALDGWGSLMPVTTTTESDLGTPAPPASHLQATSSALGVHCTVTQCLG